MKKLKLAFLTFALTVLTGTQVMTTKTNAMYDDILNNNAMYDDILNDEYQSNESTSCTTLDNEENNNAMYDDILNDIYQINESPSYETLDNEGNNYVCVKSEKNDKTKNFVFIFNKSLFEKFSLNMRKAYILEIKINNEDTVKYTEKFRLRGYSLEYEKPGFVTYKTDNKKFFYTPPAYPVFNHLTESFKATFDEYNKICSKDNKEKNFNLFNNKKCCITLYQSPFHLVGLKNIVFTKILSIENVTMDGNDKIDTNNEQEINAAAQKHTSNFKKNI